MSLLNLDYQPLALPQRLAAIRAATSGRIVFTTSFGPEDQAIAGAIFTSGLEIDVVTLDTGRLFAETYALWAETEMHYGKRIRAFYPQADAVEDYVANEGINGFYLAPESRKACCHIRKVEPLGRALRGADIWITGLRAEQSANRQGVSFAAHDAGYGLLKVNPVIDWTRDRLYVELTARQIPLNALHTKGYPSIGCAPCTRAVKPGEPERAGRWWWEEETQKECGLHVAEATA